MRVTSLLIITSFLACVSARSIDDPKNIQKFIRKSRDDNYEGDYFEGDIRLLDDDESDDDSHSNEATTVGAIGGGGTGIKDERYRWPKLTNGHVIVPYEIDAAQSYTDDEIANIKKAMNWIERVSCVQFKEQSGETNYLFFTIEGSGCWSYVGMQRAKHKKQTVNFAHTCTKRIGTMAHEMIHALGFWHAQSHTDRDEFVKINTENIIEGYEKNFKRMSASVATNFGTPYDYYSIMHYPPKAFSANGEPTIVALIEPEKYNSIMGQRNSLSPGDIKRIKEMYECEKKVADDVYDDDDSDENEVNDE
jgi:hypothetical protein